MNPKIAKTVARSIATYIVETHGNDVESLAIHEMTYDQVGDTSDFETLVKLVQNYVAVSDVHVSFEEWRLDAYGNLLTAEEAKEYRQKEAELYGF